jgi:uncharacterized protein involved in cysteine biosynthesis
MGNILFAAISKAFAQLGDPRIQRLIGLSIALTLAVFIALALLAWWLIGWLSGLHGWWAADIAQVGGVVVTLVLAWFTFPALTAAISAIFSDKVISAVEDRYYPGRPAAMEVSIWASVLDGLKLALISLIVNLITLPLLFIPPLYVVVSWCLNGYLLGREYYEMAAFRRLDRATAQQLFKARRSTFTGGGVLIAILSTIPVLNLIAPIIATAFVVHLFESVVNIGSDRAASVTHRPPSGANR